METIPVPKVPFCSFDKFKYEIWNKDLIWDRKDQNKWFSDF